jgi:REP element-mobilizing transposase RayT
VPGGLYHVILRGNHRQPIFLAQSDRTMLDDVVAESLARFGARVHAYCWMTNHVHLAVQVADTPLGPLVQRIAGQYARRVQQRLPTTGHLFEGRYRAVLVDADDHLLRLTRYIHLNPVRAGMVSDPADYAWSGHRAYLGLADVPWLTTDFTLRGLGANVASARRAYAKVIALGGDPEDSVQYSRGVPGDCRVLGPDGFLKQLAARRAQARARRPEPGRGSDQDRPSLEQLVREVAAECGISVAAMTSASRSAPLTRARCAVAERALACGVASLSAVARRLNRSHSSLCEALERTRRRRLAAEQPGPADPAGAMGASDPTDPTDPTTGTS